MKNFVILLALVSLFVLGVAEEKRYSDQLAPHFYTVRTWTVGTSVPADSSCPNLKMVLHLIDSLGGGVDSTTLKVQYGIIATYHGDTIWLRLDTTTTDGRYLGKYAKNDSTKMADSAKTIRGGIVDQQARDTGAAALTLGRTKGGHWFFPFRLGGEA